MNTNPTHTDHVETLDRIIDSFESDLNALEPTSQPTNPISPSTIVRTWSIKPASGGFGEYDVYNDPSEWAEFGDHFGDLHYLHSSEFDTEQIENISGRIRYEAGKGELYAWLDRGEWMYCLVEEQDEEDAN